MVGPLPCDVVEPFPAHDGEYAVMVRRDAAPADAVRSLMAGSGLPDWTVLLQSSYLTSFYSDARGDAYSIFSSERRHPLLVWLVECSMSSERRLASLAGKVGHAAGRKWCQVGACVSSGF